MFRLSVLMATICLVIVSSFMDRFVKAGCSSSASWRKLGSTCQKEDGVDACFCSELFKDELKVDCSGLKLTAVPANLPINTVHLILDYNKLTTLRNNDFQGCHRLKTLTVSNNSLSRLEPHVFEATQNLEELHLGDNKLSLNRHSIPQGIFSSLSKLKTLSLHRNQWQGSVEYPDWIFVDLRNLETLSIDGIPNATFGSNFSYLSNLESLAIYGGLNAITNETFQALAQCPLKQLNIKSENNVKGENMLVSLEPMSFAHFRQLTVLDLSFNRGLGLNGAAKSFYGLQFTNISDLILSRIVSQDEVAFKLTKEFYNYLILSRGLKTLGIDKNNIVTVERGLCTNMPNLEKIDASYNRISNVETLAVDISSCKKLRVIDGSRQSKRYIGKRSVTVFSGDTNKAMPPAGQNKAICSTPTHVEPCTLPVGNRFADKRSYSSGMLGNGVPLPDYGPWCLILPTKLESINLSSSLNVELFYLPQMINFGGRNFREFIYRSNGIRTLSKHLIFTQPNPNIPVTFDFSDNRLTCIAEGIMNYSLMYGLNLGRFLLSGNDLGAQLEEETEGKVFRLYSNLTELNLAKNNIKLLPRNVFIKLSALEVLNVSRNSLGQIQFEFSHMKLLKTLDFSNNLITNLNSEVIDELIALHEKSNLSINLFGNPIQCSCESIPFLRRIESNPGVFQDVQNYSCLYKDTFVSFDRLSSYILPDLNYRCSSRLILIVTTVLFAVTLFILSISVFLYRHRWDFRYFLLRLTTQRKIAQPELPKKFDAFVVYDKCDRDWVHEKLLKKLEEEEVVQDDQLPPAEINDAVDDDRVEILDANEFGCGEFHIKHSALKLCIHERDFPPGERIEENIIGAIENSRKILLVLSQNFSESQWCCYELELAKIASLDRGRNLLVPVILENLDFRKLSRGLQSLLRNYTYIDWTEHLANRSEFWLRLRKALSEPSCVYVCECGRSILGAAPRDEETE